jgi:hypothetical protein
MNRKHSFLATNSFYLLLCEHMRLESKPQGPLSFFWVLSLTSFPFSCGSVLHKASFIDPRQQRNKEGERRVEMDLPDYSM